MGHYDAGCRCCLGRGVVGRNHLNSLIFSISPFYYSLAALAAPYPLVRLWRTHCPLSSSACGYPHNPHTLSSLVRQHFFLLFCAEIDFFVYLRIVKVCLRKSDVDGGVDII